jgi:CO dehydrogenase nickel-insertion accessory protein CooC1
MDKKADGRYVVITCSATVDGLREAERVMTINKEVVIRHMVIVQNRVQAERAKTTGAPLPVDDRPDGEARPARAGRGGPRRRPR